MHPSKTTDIQYEHDSMNLSVFIVNVDCICVSIDTSYRGSHYEQNTFVFCTCPV